MSISTGYQKRRREISTVESVDTLDHMNDFFGDGKNWAQHVYDGKDGGKCLVAAAKHVQVSQIDDAKHWLRVAIKERTGLNSIEQFNDTRNSFDDIKEIITRAKELAREGASKASALVVEVLPPVRAALTVPVAALPVVQTNRLPVAANPWAVASTSSLPTLFNGNAGRAAPRRAAAVAPRPSFWDWAE